MYWGFGLMLNIRFKVLRFKIKDSCCGERESITLIDQEAEFEHLHKVYSFKMWFHFQNMNNEIILFHLCLCDKC